MDIKLSSKTQSINKAPRVALGSILQFLLLGWYADVVLGKDNEAVVISCPDCSSEGGGIFASPAT
eukprot:2434888-Amphidinium_carterae.1